jgi:hypothetical protein
MSDDMLRDAIETSRRVLGNISDFDTEGLFFLLSFVLPFNFPQDFNVLRQLKMNLMLVGHRIGMSSLEGTLVLL